MPIDSEQLNVWLDKHTLDVVVNGIRAAGLKDRRMNGEMTEEHVIKFASRAMNIATFGPDLPVVLPMEAR